MDAAPCLTPSPFSGFANGEAWGEAWPKYQALLDYGHGLYAGFKIHTHRLAEIIPRLQHATLLLADGQKYEIENGNLTHSAPYPAHQDNRFVWHHHG